MEQRLPVVQRVPLEQRLPLEQRVPVVQRLPLVQRHGRAGVHQLLGAPGVGSVASDPSRGAAPSGRCPFSLWPSVIISGGLLSLKSPSRSLAGPGDSGGANAATLITACRHEDFASAADLPAGRGHWRCLRRRARRRLRAPRVASTSPPTWLGAAGVRPSLDRRQAPRPRCGSAPLPLGTVDPTLPQDASEQFPADVAPVGVRDAKRHVTANHELVLPTGVGSVESQRPQCSDQIGSADGAERRHRLRRGSNRQLAAIHHRQGEVSGHPEKDPLLEDFAKLLATGFEGCGTSVDAFEPRDLAVVGAFLGEDLVAGLVERRAEVFRIP